LAAAKDNSSILIINSNGSVEKYKVVEEEFVKTISEKAEIIDLEGARAGRYEIKRITEYDPGIVYCIGARAYSVAYRHLDDVPVVFSSIINWLRLPMRDKTYGVSNELHSRMEIYMFRTIFPEIKKIGILYSEDYTSEWFNETREQAKELGIEIVGHSVGEKNYSLSVLKNLLKDVDAFWLISDPLVMSSKTYLFQIFEICDKYKKPVFSYHEAFARLGASLVVSADNPTIGRQAAGIAMEVLSEGNIKDEIQFPAGTHITLNLKKVKAYDLSYNMNALSSVNNIIE
jgi:putative ABC transport system substrate-binding protein